MNVQRFVAATSREALAKARMAFGDATLILSNRQIPNGVEVMATTEDMLDSITQASAQPAASGARTERLERPRPASELAGRSRLSEPLRDTMATPPLSRLAKTPVEKDADSLAMSTLSFQDYVRERMLRRRHEALQRQNAVGGADAAQALEPSPFAPQREPLPRERVSQAAAAQASAAAPSRASASHKSDAQTQGIALELQSMRDLIEERFNTLSWQGQVRQDPIQSNLMLKLIRAGYSPTLARALLERMPSEQSAAQAIRWVMDCLERNLKTDIERKPIYALGGIYALIGATGVGKTTTAAKLAAHCVKTHGAQSVGLITLDTYRVAAHEQLRSYGRMLGVVAHLAHDRAALQDMLTLLGNKKMVLIDTAGLSPRDPRAADMLELLELPKVNTLLVLNAGAHGDTHDHVLNTFRTRGDGGVILSKIDEAAKLGPALDALIRSQAVLRGTTHGQRVPEDWAQADAANLVRTSMGTSGKSALDPTASDLGYYFAQAGQALSLGELAHA